MSLDYDKIRDRNFSVNKIDISSETNLAVTSPITLTGDTLSFNQAFDFTWTGTHTFAGRTTDIYSDTGEENILTILTSTDGAECLIVFNDNLGNDGRLTYSAGLFEFDKDVSFQGEITVSSSITGNSLTINTDGNFGGAVYQVASISTPVRALNTIYQNTTGHNIKVIGSCNCLFTDNASADLAYFDCQTGSTSPPTTLNQRGGCTLSAFAVVTNSGYIVNFPFEFEVPSGHYYRILPTATGIGAVALDTWRETNK